MHIIDCAVDESICGNEDELSSRESAGEVKGEGRTQRPNNKQMEIPMRRLLTAILPVAAAAAVVTANMASSAYALDKRIRIINESDYAVSHLYTNSGDGWSGDILLGHIDPHSQRIVNFNDGSGSCTMDLRAVDHTGDYHWSRQGADVCVQETWTLGG